jgi:hypothetical protein
VNYITKVFIFPNISMPNKNSFQTSPIKINYLHVLNFFIFSHNFIEFVIKCDNFNLKPVVLKKYINTPN